MGLSPSTHIPQDVRSYNPPPVCKNKLKRFVCGDPVKETIEKMKDRPDASEEQEDGCEKLARLGKGEYYNGLIGKYGGIPVVLDAINRHNRDQLCMYKVLDALTMMAENGPNAAELRRLNAESMVRELIKLYRMDPYMVADCEKFIDRVEITGIKLAAEYVEDAVIEEDTPKVLEMCGLYKDLTDVVDTGLKAIERLLLTEEHCIPDMRDRADLALLVKIAIHCRVHHTILHRCMSIMHILSADDGLALEMGKVGAVRLMIDTVREKKSGKHGELLQLALFVLCRLVLVEANAIIFHKLYGSVATDEIEDRISRDKYDYPIAFPIRLRYVVRDREEILDRDEEVRQAKEPEREAEEKEREVYEKETLVQALVMRREAHVVHQKRVAAAWEFQGVDFDPLSATAKQRPSAGIGGHKEEPDAPGGSALVVGYMYDSDEEKKDKDGKDDDPNVSMWGKLDEDDGAISLNRSSSGSAGSGSGSEDDDDEDDEDEEDDGMSG